jgi:hypothetical protein
MKSFAAFVLCALLIALAPTTTLSAQASRAARIRLVHDTVISGVHCAPTGRQYAVIHDNGSLDECPVATDTVIAGHALPSGTWLRLLDDRTLDGAWLPADTELQGLRCKGTGYKGWAVRFFHTGQLSLCYPAIELEIDGVPCRGAGFITELTGTTQINLHTDGRLRSCRLARSIERDGMMLKSGRRITLTSEGRLVMTPPKY